MADNNNVTLYDPKGRPMTVRKSVAKDIVADGYYSYTNPKAKAEAKAKAAPAPAPGSASAKDAAQPKAKAEAAGKGQVVDLLSGLSTAADRRRTRGALSAVAQAAQQSQQPQGKVAVDSMTLGQQPMNLVDTAKQMAPRRGESVKDARERVKSDQAARAMGLPTTEERENRYKPEEIRPEFRTDNVVKGTRPDTGLGVMEWNPETGKVERTYYTRSGEKRHNKLEQVWGNQPSPLDEELRHSAARAWENADARYKADVEKIDSATDASKMPWYYLAASNEDKFTGEGGRAGVDKMMSRMSNLDLDRVMNEAWEGIPQATRTKVVEDYAYAISKYHPEMKSDEVRRNAEAMARQDSDARVYQMAVKRNMPKDNLDYIVNKISDDNLGMNLLRGAVRASTGKRGDMLAHEQAMGEYGKSHKGAALVGTVGAMTMDPALVAGGWTGGLASKGLGKLLGKAATIGEKGAGKLMTEAMTRDLANSTVGRILGATANSGVNFATFEGLGEAGRQAKLGGAVNPETGNVEDYSWDDILGQAGHGLMMGSAIGWLHPVSGALTTNAVRATSSTVGKAAAKAGIFTGAGLAEGTIFAIPELYDVYRSKATGEWKEGDQDYLDVFGNNFMFIAGMKASGLIKSAAHMVNQVSSTPEGRRGMEGRLRSWLDNEPIDGVLQDVDLGLTANERKELDRLGYNIKDLVRQPEPSGDGTRSLTGRKAEAASDPNDPKDPTGRVKSMMEDKRLSEALRAKLYYVATGRRAAMSSVIGGNIFENEDGTFTVRSYGVDGVVTSRDYKSRKAADQELSRIGRLAEVNHVVVGERYRNGEHLNNTIMEACEKVGRAHNWDAKVLYDLCRRKLKGDGSKGSAEFTEAEAELLNEVVEAAGEFNETGLVDEIRESVGSRYGVDVDKAIRKEPGRRNDAEKAAVEEYIRALFPEKQRVEPEGPEADATGTATNGPGAAVALPVMGPEADATGTATNGPGEQSGDQPADPSEAAAPAAPFGWPESGRVTLMLPEGRVANAQMTGLVVTEDNLGDLPVGKMTKPGLGKREVLLDGELEYFTVEELNQMYVNPILPEEAAAEAKPATEPEADASGTVTDNEEQPAPAPTETETPVAEAEPAPADEAAPSPAPSSEETPAPEPETTPMPMVKDGRGRDTEEPDYVAAGAERTVQHLYNEAGIPAEAADQFVSNMRDKRASELEALRGKEPVMGTSVSAYRRAKDAWDERVKALESEVAMWDDIMGRRGIEAAEGPEADTSGTVTDKSETPAAPVAGQQGGSALGRIPQREDGEPDFVHESVDAQTGWDGLVEYSGGDSEAVETAEMMLKQAKDVLKGIDKLKPKGKTAGQINASRAEIKAKREAAQAEVDRWDAIYKAGQQVLTAKNQAEAKAEAERRRIAEEQRKAEAEAKLEAEQRALEELQGIPEWHHDTPEMARRRGTRRFNGELYRRQSPVLSDVPGKETQVAFSDKDVVKGRRVIVDMAKMPMQPSHIQGQRNPMFFIEEAQPKNRTDAVSQMKEREIAETIRPEEVTMGATGYVGEPKVNARGEVVQGNNRMGALMYLWGNNLPEQQGRYRDYLKGIAGEYGRTAEEIDGMEQPVAVVVLDVDDSEAVRLGQMTAQDTESGGVERIRPKNTAQKLGSRMPVFANMLLSSEDDEATLSQIIDRNGTDVLKWLNHIGAITPTQFQSAFDSKGNIKGEAKNDLQAVLSQVVFNGMGEAFEGMFERLPVKAQRAILSTAFRDIDNPIGQSILREIQASVMVYDEMSKFPPFKDAKGLEELLSAIRAWALQTATDDSFQIVTPADNYSNFARYLAALYKSKEYTQTVLVKTFNELFDLMQGKVEPTLMDPDPDQSPRTLAEAVKEKFDFDYEPAKKGEENGLHDVTALEGNGQAGSGREPGGGGAASGGEQSSGGGEPTERGGGAADDGPTGGGRRNVQRTDEGQSDIQPYEAAVSAPLSDTETDEFGKPLVLAKDGTTIFGLIDADSGLTEAPIRLSLGENRVDAEGKNHGYGLLHIEAGHGEQIRNAGYNNIEDFVEDIAKNYTDIREGANIADNQTYLLEVSDEHNNTLFIQLSREGSYWNVNSAGIFKKKYSRRKPKVYTVPAVGGGTVTDTPDVNSGHSNGATAPAGNSLKTSEGKGNVFASDKQGNREKSSAPKEVEKGEGYTIGSKPYTNKQGKTLDTYLVTFDRDFSREEMSALRAKAKEVKGWYDRETKGWMLRSAEDAKAFAEEVMGKSEDEVADEAPLSVKGDIEPEIGIVDTMALMAAIKAGFTVTPRDFTTNMPPTPKRKAIGLVSALLKSKSLAELQKTLSDNGYPMELADALMRGKELYKDGSTTINELADMVATLFEGDNSSKAVKKGKTKVDKPAETKEQPKPAVGKVDVGDEITPEYKVGDVVELQTGEKFVIRAVNPDGSMNGRYIQSNRHGNEVSAMLPKYIKRVIKPQTSQPQDNSPKGVKKGETKVDKPVETKEQPKPKKRNKWISDEDAAEYGNLMDDLRRELGGGDIVEDEGAAYGNKPRVKPMNAEVLRKGTVVTYMMMKGGLRKFSDYCEAMVDELGDAIRPHLKSLYAATQNMEEVIAAGWDEEMDDRKTVKAFDVYNFDKHGAVDLIETAQHVVDEQASAQDVANIINQLKNKRNEQRRKEADKTSASTKTIVDEAEAVASEVENQLKDATDEETAEALAERIDKSIEKVNEQLALLGYYEADPVESDYNEAYGYMRNAERKATQDAHKLATQIASDLGLRIDTKDKVKKGKSHNFGSKLVQSNIAPAGGEVKIRIPLNEERNLYISISLDPVEGDMSELPNRQSDDLRVSGIMYRVEGKGVSAMNNFAAPETTYDDLLADIKRIVRHYLPEEKVAGNAPVELQPGEDIVAMAERVSKASKPKKRTVKPEQTMGSLFDDLFAEGEENSNFVEPTTKTNKNEKTDVRPGTSEAGGEGGHEPRQNEPLGESKRNEAQGTDGRGMAGRDRKHPVSDTERGSSVSSAPEGEQRLEPSERKNTRNNHAERGMDYAPKGEKARIDANIAAIELSQKIIEEGRTATKREMEVLRRYSGWGGLGSAFNEKDGWRDNPINKRLRELLSEEEYNAAVMSRNSAYYTPAPYIDVMWDIARALGFKGGSVLEGSAGIGNIIGLMPIDMSERSDIHAVEIDKTTGDILTLLYPDAKVEVQGFEQTNVGNGTVDLTITNVPFVTGLHVMDESGDSDLSKKFRDIHDFCIAKNVRKLREGGIGIFITSSGTLDNSQKLRDWLVSEGRADVVGAFRMNNQTFGGTAATSDIIVIRKRVNGRPSANAIDVSTVSALRTASYNTGETKRGSNTVIVKELPMLINRYYIEHPECMGGEMRFGFEEGDTYRPTSRGLFPARGKDQMQLMQEWAQRLGEMDWRSERLEKAITSTHNENETLGEGVKEGSMLLDAKGRLCVAQRGRAVPMDVNAKKIKGRTKEECFKDYKAIKDALAKVLEYQTSNESDAGLKPLLDKLNKAYDLFVERYGNLNGNRNLPWLRADVDFSAIAALETFSERGVKEGGKIKKVVTYGKTDIFSRRVVDKESEPQPQNIKDGIIASIYKYGRIDTQYMGEQLGKSEAEIRKEIVESGLGFEDPTSGAMEVSYEYLSGNVRLKLRQAKEANADGRYEANIKALEAVVPMNIPAHLIEFTLGSSWIDPKLYERYVKDRTGIDVTLTNAGGTWHMKEPYYTGEDKNIAMGVRSKMLDILIPGHKLIEAAITNKSISVSRTSKNPDGSTETVIDKDATTACATKVDEIRQDFKDWAREQMQNDTEMSQRIEDIYNEQFNNSVPKSIPDEFVPEHFGGAATMVGGNPFKLRPHQAKAVIRATTQPVMLAHEVGTGKTYTLISTAMEMRRLGTARKPMIVVQNATVGQFVASAKALYPNAKILTLEDADRNAEGRRAFYAKIKYNDWDMIVVPQSVFERIPDSKERQIQFVQDKIAEKNLVLEQMKEADPDGKSLIVRQAEKEIQACEDEIAAIANGSPVETKAGKKKEKDAKKAAVALQNAEVKAKEMLDREVDDVEDFDSMGIDALLVDEAHEYKHLGFATAMQRGVKGVDSSFSKKSQGVYLKTQAVMQKTGGKNVVFATGTPISNTAAEIWTFMRYLMSADVMKDYGIYYFDDFVRNFGNLQQMMEFTTSGKYKENNRFAGYVNLPELVRIWSSVADTVLTREAGGVTDKIPELEGGKAQDIFLPQTRALRGIMKYVKAQLDAYDNMTGKEKKENSHIPLVMYGIAKAAAVDARLVQADAEDDPHSKTNEAVRQTLRSLEDTKEYSGTVAIFADSYQNKTSGFNLYEDIRGKLIAAGVPEEQIVVMKSGMTVKKKAEIFDKVNAGEVRVIMGSTFTLGTGVNIQERLNTVIHLDAPNRPMDYTQRNGRILRQGNLHKDLGLPVKVLRFGVEDSLDVTAYQRLKTKGAIADSIMNGKRLMSNSMENRAIEEEQDLFGDMTAQLSGSEYALLKNQIEKEVKKLTAKLKIWEADQTYIHNRKRTLLAQNKSSEQRIATNQDALSKVEAAKVDGIIVGKHTYASIDDMAGFIKEQNKKKHDRQEEVRSSYASRPAVSDLTVSVGGFDFNIHTEISRELKSSQGDLFSTASAKMTYSCEALGLKDVPVHQQLIKNALTDIMENVMTGKDMRERIESSERSIERNNAELSKLSEREGAPFEFSDALTKAKEKLIEAEELMRKELADIEAKYAELDAEVDEAQGVSFSEENEGEEVSEPDGKLAYGLGVEEMAEALDEAVSSHMAVMGELEDEGHTDKGVHSAIVQLDELWQNLTSLYGENPLDEKAALAVSSLERDIKKLRLEELRKSVFPDVYTDRDGKETRYTSANKESYSPTQAGEETEGVQEGGSGLDHDGGGADGVRRQGDPALYTSGDRLNAETGEFCRVERVFRENGSFSFTTGERIESSADVAFIFSALEDAAKEHSFAVLVKEGRPTVVELGMGSFTATSVDTSTALLACERIKPDEVYFVHNHPSGNLVCSPADVTCLQHMSAIAGVPTHGVIINLKTGKYGTFTADGRVGIKDKSNPEGAYPLAVHTLDKQIFAPEYDPSEQPLIRGHYDVASFLNSHRMGDRSKISFLIISRSGRVVGNIHTPYTSLENGMDEIARYVCRHVIEFGGDAAIMYGDFDMQKSAGTQYMALKGRMQYLGNVGLTDVVKMEGNNARSAVDLDLIYEPKGEHGAGGPRADASGTVTDGAGDDKADTDRSVEAKRARAEALAERYNTGVTMVDDVERVKETALYKGADAAMRERMLKSKGWYDPSTGEVVVVLPNNEDVEDVSSTVFHELVGHKGLRELVGQENYDVFLDEVYTHLRSGLRKEVEGRATRSFLDDVAKNGERARSRDEHLREAMDEKLAEVSQKDPERMSEDEKGFWETLKERVLRAIDRFLGSLKLPKWVRLGDNELRYMVWRSHESLKGRVPGASTVAEGEGARAVEYAGIRFRGEGDQFFDGSQLGLHERMTDAALALSEGQKDDLQARDDAMRLLGRNLSDLRRAMSLQSKFDQTTVKRVSDLARVLIRNGYLSEMKSQEMDRLLAAVANSVGHKAVDKQVQTIMDVMVGHQLSQTKQMFDKLLKMKGSKIDASGVTVGKGLDPEGQRMMDVFRETYKLPVDQITDLQARAEEKIANGDATEAEEAGWELTALHLSEDYANSIVMSQAEESGIKRDLEDAESDYKAGRMSAEAFRQYRRAAEDALRQNHIERAEAYRVLMAGFAGKLDDSMRRSEEFRQREKERINSVHHAANADMQGRPYDEHRKESLADKIVNSSVVSFFTQALRTADQMLRMLNPHAVEGKGYVYNLAADGWQVARDKEIAGIREKCRLLDEKVAEIFGDRGMTVGKLLYKADGLAKKAGKEGKMTVSFWDGGGMKDHELGQCNLMYIYMVNKMIDGAMKLRRMGIEEADVDRIKDALDPRLVTFADWVQESFLTETHKEYNQVHRELFGASMASIEHYFPLKILSNARVTKEDVASDDAANSVSVGGTKTGAIINRQRNSLALDLTNANALMVLLDHVREMEHWAAYAGWTKNVNTLLSYKRFRNQVQNMTTIYGGGEELWRRFKECMRIAAGTYRSPMTEADKFAVNAGKAHVSMAIALRPFTALKQTLSAPSYIPEISIRGLMKSLANPQGDLKWCMENLPQARERWESKMSGDSRLMKTEADWSFWDKNWMQRLSKANMSMNAAVDFMTVAYGARAIYETHKRIYMEESAPGKGATETSAQRAAREAYAERRAKMDAESLFNQTQQSWEALYMSPIQRNRTLANALYAQFRNSSMSYTRQEYDACRSLSRNATRSQRAVNAEWMKRKILREWGMDPDNADSDWSGRAERAAKKRVSRQVRKDLLRVATFRFINQWFWLLSPSVFLLMSGDDEDEKREILKNGTLQALMFGGAEGLPGGDALSQFGASVLEGDPNWTALLKQTPLMGNMTDLARKFKNEKWAEAWCEAANYAAGMVFGMNPQVAWDFVTTVEDIAETLSAGGDDPYLSTEATIFAMRLLNVPQSQIERLYFNEVNLMGSEASKMTPKELAHRYAVYKAKREAPYYKPHWEDEEVISQKEKAAMKRIREMAEGHGNREVNEWYGRITEGVQPYVELDKAFEQAKKSDLVEAANIMTELNRNPKEYRRYRRWAEADAVLGKLAEDWLDQPDVATGAALGAEMRQLKSDMVKSYQGDAEAQRRVEKELAAYQERHEKTPEDKAKAKELNARMKALRGEE